MDVWNSKERNPQSYNREDIFESYATYQNLEFHTKSSFVTY